MLALAALAGLLAACAADSAAPVVDGGIPRDALVVEAGPQPDSGADASTVLDAEPVPVMCPVSECDPRMAEDCGEDPCVLGGAGGAVPMCVEGMLGDAGEGESCELVTDCADGLACFAAGAAGVCARPCCPDGIETCAGGQRCVGSGVLVGDVVTAWWRCVEPRPCDLLATEGSGCSLGEACYIVSDKGDTDCMRAGEAGPGDACAAPNDCAAGLFCGARGSCERICRLAAGTDACPAGQYCSMYRHTPDGAGLCTPEAMTRE
jgi:hypothetical protein